MGKDDFPGFIAENEYVFANFYAPWCVWCQRLGPTWEAFAETVEKQQFNIKVGREGGREGGGSRTRLFLSVRVPGRDRIEGGHTVV